MGHSAFIQSRPIEVCMDKLKNEVSYYFSNSVQLQCLAYFNGYKIHQMKDLKLCDGDYLKDNDEVQEDLHYSLKYKEIFAELFSFEDFLPKELLEKYDTRFVARLLIERKTVEMSNSDTKESAYNFMQDSRIIMGVSFNILELIKENGFLNQHQTKSTKGALAYSRRRIYEDNAIGVRVERRDEYVNGQSVANTLRPKYSYLVLDKAHPGIKTKINPQYGNVFVVFKNKMKLRSTFTAGDSLDTEADWSTTYTYSLNLNRFPRLKKDYDYFESQVWGELTLKDVDSFLVNCIEPLTAQQISQIKDLGKPVFNCYAEYEHRSQRPYNLVPTFKH